ncbi:zinc ribbon domain-containing protein [Streptomyces sp. NPDC047315]|uniref:Zn-ribbon domain-containing OB-fold protein n=1 Tax=Streptomyces sp. NPDC047315 TaxID=3155142 RepID=UPI0033F2E768
MSQPGTDSLAAPSAQAEDAGSTYLTYQSCRWCGTASFRKLLCPVCASSDLEPRRSTGEGVVIRSSVVHRYTRVARNESLVRFPEGFMFRCRVVGAAPHLVWVGARVRPVAESGLDAGELVVELCDTVRSYDWK